MQIFFTTLNAGNQYQQQRLNGAGSTTGQLSPQYATPGGYIPSNQFLERYTFPPITKHLGYRSDGETGYIPREEFNPPNNGYNLPDNGNRYHHHGHYHHGYKDFNYDDSSEEQFERPKNFHYPQTLPPNNGDVDKVKYTTDRHYRNTQPFNNFSISIVTTKRNTTDTRSIPTTIGKFIHKFKHIILAYLNVTQFLTKLIINI